MCLRAALQESPISFGVGRLFLIGSGDAGGICFCVFWVGAGQSDSALHPPFLRNTRLSQPFCSRPGITPGDYRDGWKRAAKYEFGPDILGMLRSKTITSKNVRFQLQQGVEAILCGGNIIASVRK